LAASLNEDDDNLIPRIASVSAVPVYRPEILRLRGELSLKPAEGDNYQDQCEYRLAPPVAAG
jgi:hypothetical protein